MTKELREAFEKWADRLADKNQQSVMAEDDDHRSSVSYGADYTFDLLSPALEALNTIATGEDGCGQYVPDLYSVSIAQEALAEIKRKLEEK